MYAIAEHNAIINENAINTAVVENLIATRIAGEQPGPELTRWLQQVPPKLTEHFVKIGLLDNERAAAAKNLEDHIDDFEVSLRAKNRNKKYSLL